MKVKTVMKMKIYEQPLSNQAWKNCQKRFEWEGLIFHLVFCAIFFFLQSAKRPLHMHSFVCTSVFYDSWLAADRITLLAQSSTCFIAINNKKMYILHIIQESLVVCNSYNRVQRISQVRSYFAFR